MALKKSELYSSLWASCDELRGGMDASQYKDYVLVLLFVKYVSDRYAGEPYALLAPIMAALGIKDGDVAAQVFSGVEWKELAVAERRERLLAWLKSEIAYAELH